MIPTFLPEATNFQDIPVRDIKLFPGDNPVPCPVCKGHGYWNNRLNAYGKRKHFQSHCTQCGSHGYVEKDSPDALCVHTMKEISHEKARQLGATTWGSCCHAYQCTVCGIVKVHDSSD